MLQLTDLKTAQCSWICPLACWQLWLEHDVTQVGVCFSIFATKAAMLQSKS